MLTLCVPAPLRRPLLVPCLVPPLSLLLLVLLLRRLLRLCRIVSVQTTVVVSIRLVTAPRSRRHANRRTTMCQSPIVARRRLSSSIRRSLQLLPCRLSSRIDRVVRHRLVRPLVRRTANRTRPPTTSMRIRLLRRSRKITRRRRPRKTRRNSPSLCRRRPHSRRDSHVLAVACW
jgi:hypothetical protein